MPPYTLKSRKLKLPFPVSLEVGRGHVAQVWPMKYKPKLVGDFWNALAFLKQALTLPSSCSLLLSTAWNMICQLDLQLPCDYDRNAKRITKPLALPSWAIEPMSTTANFGTSPYGWRKENSNLLRLLFFNSLLLKATVLAWALSD